MEVFFRAVSSGRYEPEHVDAISCTYNMGGFSPMNSVLVAYGLEREHFKNRHIERQHSARGFTVIAHGDFDPCVITASKAKTWSSISDASLMILRIAELEQVRSLRFTQFGWTHGGFPALAFKQLMRSVHLAHLFTKVEKIVVDVDEKFLSLAISISNAEYDCLNASIEDTGVRNLIVIPKWDPKNIELQPLVDTSYLHEKAETGDTASMTSLGQYYRSDFPLLAIKWLSLATGRGSGAARTILENTQSQTSGAISVAGQRLGELWLSDLANQIATNSMLDTDLAFQSWLLWRQGSILSR